MMGAYEEPVPNEGDKEPAPRRATRRASLDLKEQAMYASHNVRRLSMEMQTFDTSLPTIQPSIDENSEIDSSHLRPERSIRFDMKGMGEKGDDDRNMSMKSSVSDSMRQLQISMDAMEIVNASNARNKKTAEFPIGSPNTPSDMNNTRKLQLNAENQNEIESPKAPSRTVSLSKRVSRALEESPTAKSVFNRLRRLRSRSASTDSIDTEHSRRSSDCSIDVDLQYQTQQEQDSALEMLKKQAYESCLEAIRQHLFAFIAETPNVTYEEWIEELHPENAKSMRNMVRGKRIDHRFYMDDSDHRKLWNENLDEEREFVPVRTYNPDDQEKTQNLAKVTKTFNRGPQV
mmetsp:Transcript_30234/g.46130  ORF Transcript_30234/g.46130 Transcript_30234/m.46130 type:complete len:345 (+) Transcript_30234:146-1180(+)|eukprot:CAMPEP_0194201216 /NCGR_PEP_ID=MMETSP0156-20130528/1539_1 /TAXON_ID=33649 /ORGANISM="Thalassionema nitzschioides, Strain L26-B" /LENGTH=344 /DNA_ID=CAMNT_0038926347 /DNA_START=120 /DNA_END=1154 /DNA_ORIENTATION=+